MTKQSIPLYAVDISQFSRSLAKQLGQDDAHISHLSLMNMLARAAGFRNFQHMRAAHKTGQKMADGAESAQIDHGLVARCLQHIDAQGVMRNWPSRQKVRNVCVWLFWGGAAAQRCGHVRKAGEFHLESAPCIWRCGAAAADDGGAGHGDAERDGSDYQRVEQKPPAEALELIRQAKARRVTGV